MVKSTGMLKQIDELGRIVIPKEIRNKLSIKNGEALEIFTTSDSIILKKYSVMSDLGNIAQNCVDSFNENLNKNFLVTDMQFIIAATKKYKKRYVEMEITDYIVNLIGKKCMTIYCDDNPVNIINNVETNANFLICPVVLNNEAVGSVIVLSHQKIDSLDEKCAKTIAGFLLKYLK